MSPPAGEFAHPAILHRPSSQHFVLPKGLSSYPWFSLYFRDDDTVTADATLQIFNDFVTFFKSRYAPSVTIDRKLKRMVVPVDLGGILGCSDEKIVRLPTFERLSVGIQEAPDLYRQCIGLAAHYVCSDCVQLLGLPS